MTRAEAVEYLRVLPFANGLPSWEPAPAAWHPGQGAWPPPAAPASAEQLEAYADQVMEPGFRPQAAFVNGKIAGGSALLALELTVPGLRVVPMGGVTSTGVMVTHRRQGLLRAMMSAMFADARSHGESLLGLSASEGGIYGRFGFSPATHRCRWELERAQVQFADPAPPPGVVELIDADTARSAWTELHEKARSSRVGDISADPHRWEGLSSAPHGTDGPLWFVVHRDEHGVTDGIASYRLPWSPDESAAGTLVVEEFEAVSLAAYSALWRLLADFDLTRRVVAASRPFDEPLRWMLRNPRALRVTRCTDNLWIRVLDVPVALQARAYDTDAVITFAISEDPMCPQNTGTWRLEVSGGQATCRPAAGDRPEITTDINVLGSLYLGGMSAGTLAAAGRIIEHARGALSRFSRMLSTDPAPFNSIGF